MQDSEEARGADDDPARRRVDFGIERDAPEGGAAQKRAHDRALGIGTMSGSGAACRCCGAVATMADIRAEGRAGRMGARMTAVVVDGQQGKEYRLPTEAETAAARVGREDLDALYAEIPSACRRSRFARTGLLASGLPRYGFETWGQLFTDRQLLALGTFVRELRRCAGEMDDDPDDWREAVIACLAICVDRLADYSSTICSWHNGRETISHTFARFALPMVWDYAEVDPLSGGSGNFLGALEWIARVLEHLQDATAGVPEAQVLRQSAIEAPAGGGFDAIVTDSPYYTKPTI